jgi:ubiquinone/menaquinone biosynthesis C-methylase UbiE
VSIKKSILRKYMGLLSSVNRVDPTWEGYRIARSVKTEEERQAALLRISENRYRESKESTLDSYFRTSLRSLLHGRDALEIGSNHGGASLAYFEMYGLRSITGLDTTESEIEISKVFFKSKGISSGFDFVQGYGENLPFSANSFDAIIAFDVFEHVQDLKAVVGECLRVLRPGGKLLTAFPSFYHPTQHHLFSVSRAPFIHYLFSSKDIMDVFYDILDDNPEYRDRIGARRRPLEPWERLYIINGTTLRMYRKIVFQYPWSNSQQIYLPLGLNGRLVKTHPVLKGLLSLTWIASRLPGLEEVFNNRISFIHTK